MRTDGRPFLQMRQESHLAQNKSWLRACVALSKYEVQGSISSPGSSHRVAVRGRECRQSAPKDFGIGGHCWVHTKTQQFQEAKIESLFWDTLTLETQASEGQWPPHLYCVEVLRHHKHSTLNCKTLSTLPSNPFQGYVSRWFQLVNPIRFESQLPKIRHKKQGCHGNWDGRLTPHQRPWLGGSGERPLSTLHFSYWSSPLLPAPTACAAGVSVRQSGSF